MLDAVKDLGGCHTKLARGDFDCISIVRIARCRRGDNFFVAIGGIAIQTILGIRANIKDQQIV